MELVIVESPTKAKTISKFLGTGYTVASSYGHVRDLPKSKLGIDTENNFEPHYITPRASQKTVNHLRKIAEKADALVLATDEDREGEAIAWHLVRALAAPPSPRNTKTTEAPIGKKPIKRIVFHEITKTAIEKALREPRTINENLVDAQQARRVLDRLVGYKLSPFLWKKVSRGLSAGRVQSVALRLIVDREEEIKKFKPEEYWTIAAHLETRGSKKSFEAILQKINGEIIPKIGITNKKDADAIERELRNASFTISMIERNEMRKSPLPPFITSTLQQESVKRLGFSSKKTMFLAQNLYENGYITYMRTDSVNLSGEALSAGAEWITKNLPRDYHLKEPRIFKKKSRLAQEAHEAIRPTKVDVEPPMLRSDKKMERDHQKLYDLIWKRFVASQLPEAIFDTSRIEVAARASKTYTLVANGSVLRFDGFLKIWPSRIEENELPLLSENDELALRGIKSEPHVTEPPPRYNEASLIKTLEKYGIGRPSTYAPIISVIQERNYVEKRERRFYPTDIGTIVNKMLTENFPEIVDIQFTAKMEENLDEIAQGHEEWRTVIKEFYNPFSKHLEKKYEEVSREELITETTDETCEKCGKPMKVKLGRFGKFLACSGFPECKNTKSLKEAPQSIGLTCPKCLQDSERKNNPGEVIIRRVHNGRARGKIFWGCSRYPACDYASWTNPLVKKKKE